MVCSACGASNPDSSSLCRQCGRGLGSRDDAQTVLLDEGARGHVAPASGTSPAIALGPVSSQPGTMGPPGFAPGSQFGRYRIEALLGEGGMGAVYRAVDTELDRTVALKLVRPELATSPQAMQRFKQELLLASRITHKNVLRIHDLGDWNGVKFISMAFVEGMDLSGLLDREGRLPIERALHFTRQLCAALDAAHSEGVVHRDLKPQNILIDRADNLYVSDFGLAKSLEAEISMGTRTGQILGTPRYMSPEQVEAREVDARTDLYALGLIACEMFTGELPFRGDSAMQLMYQRVMEPPRDPRAAHPELPEYIANVILKCLEKDPARRYRSAREILADLDAQSAPRPAARPGAQTISLQIPKPTRRGVLWTCAAAAVVAGTLAVVPTTRHAIRGMLPGGRTAQQASIRYYMAVLPLTVAGDEDALRYLAEGVVDSLTAKLGGLHDVYVASNVSPSMAQRPNEQIASALGVGILVRGTIASAGDDVSVTIKAEDVKAHRVLLSQVYQGVRKDFLTVEDQVFNGLVNALVIRRSDEERARTTLRPTQDVEAYDLYMKGRDKLHGTWSLANGVAAARFFEEATQRDGGFALAYAGLADACVRMWQENHDAQLLERARNAAEQARRLNDRLAEVHTSLGTIDSHTGLTDGAIIELKRALQLAPNSDEVWRRLGFVYGNGGHYEDEASAYREAVRINPYFWANHSGLGTSYLDLGRNENALAEFQQAARLAPPDVPTGWANSGSALYRLGRLEECVNAFQKAISISPKASYYSFLGVAYFYEGRLAEATQAFETAVKKDPNQVQSWVNLGDAYRQSASREKASEAYDRAVALAYRALETNDKNANALGILATAYAKKGDIDKAAKFIAQARQLDPKDNDLMYRDAVVRAVAGDIPKALETLKQAGQNGYTIFEARTDPEWAAVRSRPEFTVLFQTVQEKSAR